LRPVTQPPPDREPDPSFAAALVAMRPELCAHALRLTRHAAQAEDLVQDSVERALRFEDHFVRGTNLRAWAHQILSNVFFTRCRQARREGRALGVLATDPCAWTAGREQPRERTGLSRATRLALSSLPAQFRSAVVLVDLMDYSYKAAADELGVPLGTVMSRLHRGRKLLAQTLREEPLEREAA
jgi:RNA polymerase sigma-70 factor (ECF subfamily)